MRHYYLECPMGVSIKNRDPRGTYLNQSDLIIPTLLNLIDQLDVTEMPSRYLILSGIGGWE